MEPALDVVHQVVGNVVRDAREGARAARHVHEPVVKGLDDAGLALVADRARPFPRGGGGGRGGLVVHGTLAALLDVRFTLK